MPRNDKNIKLAVGDTQRPKISIIVPTLNEEKYIEPTLKSILNQDYKGKYEVIVADGGSRDSTVRIARKYADRVIRVERKSISAGRNAGAELAKGDILLFVDADTILLYNTISSMHAAFKEKDVMGATCTVLPISSGAMDIMLYIAFNKFANNSLKIGTKKAVGVCCMYRKSAFDKVGGFDEDLKTLEDFNLSSKICRLGKIENVNGALALTSVRRLKRWGKTKAARKYLTMYLKYLLTGNGYSTKQYRPIR